jgi:DNA-binding transcriptional regulator YhcF (GntR family)
MAERLIDTLRKRAEGLGPATPFPSGAELADEYHFEPSAIRHVMQTLIAEGIVVSQGRGPGARYVTTGGEIPQTGAQQAVHQLRRLVEDPAAGSHLPSQREAAQELGVSPATIAAEYRRLQNERKVTIKHGRHGGVFKV